MTQISWKDHYVTSDPRSGTTCYKFNVRMLSAQDSSSLQGYGCLPHSLTAPAREGMNRTDCILFSLSCSVFSARRGPDMRTTGMNHNTNPREQSLNESAS